VIPPDSTKVTLRDVATVTVRQALAGPGVWLDIGLATLRIRSDCPDLAAQLQSGYRNFRCLPPAAWADLHVDLARLNGPRRWIRPQVLFQCDGERPFEPFPADTALPLLEWGTNWLIGQRMHHTLLLHAGVVERDGLALVMPATPGSGKSTLTAALGLRGWRLLSDEFGAFDLQRRAFRPVLKPVALKNQSIEVIRRFSPSAELGPEFPKTRKGTVAHLAAPLDAVNRVHELARPGAVLLPKWEAGSATRWTAVPARDAFTALAFNAFNYEVAGEAGFRAVVHLVRRCPAWQLTYSNLDDALARIDAEWPAVVTRSASHGDSGA
jgi:HprK-related kinase A